MIGGEEKNDNMCCNGLIPLKTQGYLFIRYVAVKTATLPTKFWEQASGQVELQQFLEGAVCSFCNPI